jgi:predicted peroxiredoxin
MNAPPLGAAMLVWSAGLEQPERVATLFMAAQACAAMEMPTELYFTGASVRLLARADAATLVGYGAERKCVGDWLAETLVAGVRVFACSQALQGLQLAADALHGSAERGGVVQFAARAADPAWRTMVF